MFLSEQVHLSLTVPQVSPQGTPPWSPHLITLLLMSDPLLTLLN